MLLISRGSWIRQLDVFRTMQVAVNAEKGHRPFGVYTRPMQETIE